VQPPRNVDPTLAFGFGEVGERLVDQFGEALFGRLATGAARYPWIVTE
jgi:hypothetical protein